MTSNVSRPRKPSKRSVHISPRHSPFVKAWRDLTGEEKIGAATQAAMKLNGAAATVNIEQQLETILWTQPCPIRCLE